MFTLKAWKEEVFSFYNVLPGCEPCEGEEGRWEEKDAFSLEVVDVYLRKPVDVVKEELGPIGAAQFLI